MRYHLNGLKLKAINLSSLLKTAPYKEKGELRVNAFYL